MVAVTDLANIVFFYLLSVGECTMPTANIQTRIMQFWVRDVVFYHCGRGQFHAPISHDSIA